MDYWDGWQRLCIRLADRWFLSARLFSDPLLRYRLALLHDFGPTEDLPVCRLNKGRDDLFR
jgi:hypothetical protein